MACDDDAGNSAALANDANITLRFQNIAFNDLSTQNVSVSVKVLNTEAVSTSFDIHYKKAMYSPNEVKAAYSQDQDGDTDLHIAIIQKEPCLVMNYIAMAPHSDWLNICNSLLQTPLHLAVITRQIDVVRRLMTAGASLDARDNQGNTPLHIASREGFDEIVECLLTPVRLEETAQNSFKPEFQNIPQDLSCKNYDGLTCVHLAAMAGCLRALDSLLTVGADINAGDGKSGRTPLHYAVETGNRIVLHYLLTWKQTDVNCLTYGGLSPLRLACGRGFQDIVDILIQKGAYTDTVEQDD